MEAESLPNHLKLLGRSRLPDQGGFLLLPSRMDIVELAAFMGLLRGREVVLLIEEEGVFSAAMQQHLEREDVRAMAFSTARLDAQGLRATLQREVREGRVVIFIPGLGHAPAASSVCFSSELGLALAACELPMVPLMVQRNAEVALGLGPVQGAVMVLGELLKRPSWPQVQESLLALGREAFEQHPILEQSLGWLILQGLKRHGAQRIIDGKEQNELRFDALLGVAAALAVQLRRETRKKRVAVVLPPGIAGFIANMAVVLAGKVPVNLNFTASLAGIEHAIEAADVDRFITADAFVRKAQHFPWPPSRQQILLERLIPSLKNKATMWGLAARLLPTPLLAMLLGVRRSGGRGEATLLFTSGSSGTPKGVVMSHRNLVANVIQFGSRLALGQQDSVLACLPLFHSFGCTVTLWYPAICGIGVVTYPSPMEARKLAELIEKHHVSLMISTPTFLRGYLRGVNREALTSVKFCVTGAEKLPASVAEAFTSKFGRQVLEGYGLTETSPVSNLNLPTTTPAATEVRDLPHLPCQRAGSVGLPVPGIALRICHPQTRKPQPLDESGVICFKGPNVFEGYLDDQKRTAAVKDEEDWFWTGDVGRLDADGFLHIEGRLSRFSKIAGEMVPHEAVEDALLRALDLQGESVRRLAVVGIPDVDKGEALVLLMACPERQQDMLQLRYELLERGVPALWIPKRMIRVPDIPVLSSGKLDAQACEKLALTHLH